MSTEIERRFILKDPQWRPEGIAPLHIEQGFFALGEAAQGCIKATPSGSVFHLDAHAPIPLSQPQAAACLPVTDNGVFPAGYKARIRCYDHTRYVLDIKGPRQGAVRFEVYEIPLTQAQGAQLLALCGSTVLSKDRYPFTYAGKLWVLDIYAPPHSDKRILEVELTHRDQPLSIPECAGEEITNDKLFRA